MLNNLTNFFNLIVGRRIKTTLEPTDLIAVGTKQSPALGDYKPTAIQFSDLQAQLGGGGGGITLTTTGTSGPSTLIGNTLNVPNYATGGLPAWVETDATDLTIWCNGQGNIGSNTSYGEFSLKSNTTGAQNTAIGQNTLPNNTTGYTNIAIGARALFSNTLGYENLALGNASLFSNIDGTLNTALGHNTLYSNTTGSKNTAVGHNALQNNQTGISNTAVGSGALFSSTTAFDNVAIGKSSLSTNTTGVNNSAIGVATNSGNFNGSVILGKEATATNNNQFVVGSSTVNAGAITTEVITPDTTWTVRINGADYKIPLLLIP